MWCRPSDAAQADSDSGLEQLPSHIQTKQYPPFGVLFPVDWEEFRKNLYPVQLRFSCSNRSGYLPYREVEERDACDSRKDSQDVGSSALESNPYWRDQLDRPYRIRMADAHYPRYRRLELPERRSLLPCPLCRIAIQGLCLCCPLTSGFCHLSVQTRLERSTFRISQPSARREIAAAWSRNRAILGVKRMGQVIAILSSGRMMLQTPLRPSIWPYLWCSWALWSC